MVVDVFKKYMKAEAHTVGKNDFEKNLKDKLKHPGFRSDLKPLLSANVNYDDREACELVYNNIISRL